MGDAVNRLLTRQRFPCILVLLLVAAYLVLAIGHAQANSPWCDEAWFASPAKNLLEHGSMGTPVLASTGWKPRMNLTRIQERTYWIMPLHIVTQAALYRVVGFSLLAQRALSILWGAVLLAVVGRLVWCITTHRGITLLTLTLLSFDYYFLTRVADGRMDVMAAALAFSASAAYGELRSRHLLLACLAGSTLAAAAAFTHPIGGFMAVTLLGLFLLQDRQRLTLPLLFALCLPFAVGAAAWGIYILQDVAAFRAQMGSNAVGRAGSFTHPWIALKQEFAQKYLSAFGLNGTEQLSLQQLRLLTLLAYVAGIIGAVFSPARALRPGWRQLLAITLVSVLVLAVIDGHKRFYYVIYVLPWFAALLSAWIVDLWENQRVPALSLAGALAALLVLQVSGSVYRIRQDNYRKTYLPLVQAVQSHGGSQSHVIGSAELGYGLNFSPRLVDDLSLGYYDGARPELIFFPDWLYGAWLEDMRGSSPEVYRHVHKLLRSEYRKVYEGGGYHLYERRVAPAQVAAR